MKFPICLAAAVALVLPPVAFPQTTQSPTDVRWGGAARFHAGHDKLKDVPFDGDWSYGMVCEIREQQAYFQFIMSCAPKVSFTGKFDEKEDGKEIDKIWSPEFNLIYTQGAWAGGLGIMKHHVRTDKGGTWSPVFYQFLLGLNLGKRSGLSFDVMGCYEFSKWDNLSDIRTKDMDVRISITRAL